MAACAPPSPRNVLLASHVVAATLHLTSFCLLLSLTAVQPSKEFPSATGPLAYTYTNNASAADCAVPRTDWRVDAVVAHPYVDATPLRGVQLNEALTCLSHVVGAVFAAQNMLGVVEARRRWVEYAVTAGILEISILVGFGVRDWFALLLVFSLNIGLQASGGLSLDEARERFPGSAFYLQQRFVLLVQSFVFLGVQIAYTVTTALEAGTPGVGDTLVVSSVLYACFYASFGVVQTLSHCAPGFDARYDTPVFFVLLSVTSKLCLSWHAVHVQQLVEETIQGTSDGPTTVALRAAVTWMYGVSAVLIVAYTAWRSLLTLPATLAANRPPRLQYVPLKMRVT